MSLQEHPALTTAALAAAFLAWWFHATLLIYLQLVAQLRPRLGLVKAPVFAFVLVQNFMRAWPEAIAAVQSASAADFYAYVPEKPTDIGMLFVPGALVDPDAYAPTLKSIADESDAVVVCARLATRHPVALPMARANELMARFPAVRKWVVGGHSMGAGGFGAAGLVQQSLRSAEPQAEGAAPEGAAAVVGLVMWAGAITRSMGVDLSGTRLPCLVLLASEDTVVPPKGNAEDGSAVLANLDARCPAGFELSVLEGGNHAGFGHYGPQNFPFADGERTVPHASQQREVVERTSRFLRQRFGSLERPMRPSK